MKRLKLGKPNPFEESNIEKLAKEYRNRKGAIPTTHLEDEIFELAFRDGYKAAHSKQFSLEDVENILTKYLEEGFISKEQGYISPKKFVQSLSTQQLPKEFIPEYKDFLEGGLGNPIEVRRFKTITNSEGKQELVGIYKY